MCPSGSITALMPQSESVHECCWWHSLTHGALSSLLGASPAVAAGAQVLHVREVFTTESFINIIVPEDATSSPSPCPTTCEGADCGAASAEGGCCSGGGGNTSVWAVPAKEEREIVKLAFRSVGPSAREPSPPQGLTRHAAAVCAGARNRGCTTGTSTSRPTWRPWSCPSTSPSSGAASTPSPGTSTSARSPSQTSAGRSRSRSTTGEAAPPPPSYWPGGS